jgi:hypothetical protein
MNFIRPAITIVTAVFLFAATIRLLSAPWSLIGMLLYLAGFLVLTAQVAFLFYGLHNYLKDLYAKNNGTDKSAD